MGRTSALPRQGEQYCVADLRDLKQPPSKKRDSDYVLRKKLRLSEETLKVPFGLKSCVRLFGEYV